MFIFINLPLCLIMAICFPRFSEKPYCHSCHTKNFGIHGYGYGQGAGVLSMDFGVKSSQSTAPAEAKPQTAAFDGKAKPGGPDDCPWCGKRVYAAEKKLAAGRVCNIPVRAVARTLFGGGGGY